MNFSKWSESMSARDIFIPSRDGFFSNSSIRSDSRYYKDFSKLQAYLQDSFIIPQKAFKIILLEDSVNLFTYNLYDCAFFIIKKGQELFVAHKDYQNSLEPLRRFLSKNKAPAHVLLLAGLKDLEVSGQYYAKQNLEHLMELFGEYDVMFDEAAKSYSTAYNFRSQANIHVTVLKTGEVKLTTIDSIQTISQAALLRQYGPSFEYIYPYHPQEILPPAGEELLPLRSEADDYILSPAMQQRLFDYARLVQLYELYISKGCMILRSGNTERGVFYEQNKCFLDKVHRIFGQLNSYQQLYISDEVITRFNVLKTHYNQSLSKFLEHHEIEYKSNEEGLITAHDGTVQKIIMNCDIEIQPGAINTILIEALNLTIPSLALNVTQ